MSAAIQLVVMLALLVAPDIAVRSAWAAPEATSAPCTAPRVEERPISKPGGDARIRTVALASSYPDTSDQGNGSFRLCLDGERSVKGHAWCRWTEDRRGILEVWVQDARAGGRRLDLFVRAATGLGADLPQDQRLNIELRRTEYAAQGGTLAVTGSHAEGFRLRFEASRRHRPEAEPLTGTLAVRCGKAPPLEPDRSLGTLSLWLSDDPDRVFEMPAICEWATWDNRYAMVRVDATTTRARVADDRFVSLNLGLADGGPRSAEARLTWTPAFDFNGETWLDSRYAFPLWTPQERRAGTVRAHRLLPEEVLEFDPHVDEGPPPEASPLGMVATWACDDPPHHVSARIRWPEWHGRPGLVTVDLPGLPAGTLLAASCGAHEDEDAGRTDVGSVAASFLIDGRPALLLSDWTGFVALYLRAPDGSLAGDLVMGPTGEYAPVWEGDDGGHVEIPPVVLERSVLTLDPSVPATIPLTMTWDCPPGLDTLG